MQVVIALIVFLLLAGGFSLFGLRLWVRPKAAMDRIAGVVSEPEEPWVRHPSLAFRDLIDRVGALIPRGPKDTTVMQRRLIRAGHRNAAALKLLYGAKTLLGVAAPLVAFGFVSNLDTDPSNKVVAVAAAAAIGFFGPNEYVRLLGKRRQHQIQRGLPNALDLLVVCVESGLGLDQAVMQVAKELDKAHPEISEEFTLVNLELKAGNRRAEALRNLAERSAVDELKKLTAVLIQADRFGTSIAQGLRAHADYMRVQARQVAEEKAAKLGVKLIFPIFFCILPSLFVVTVGPVMVRLVRDLIPMMNNM